MQKNVIPKNVTAWCNCLFLFARLFLFHHDSAHQQGECQPTPRTGDQHQEMTMCGTCSKNRRKIPRMLLEWWYYVERAPRIDVQHREWTTNTKNVITITICRTCSENGRPTPTMDDKHRECYCNEDVWNVFWEFTTNTEHGRQTPRMLLQ